MNGTVTHFRSYVQLKIFSLALGLALIAGPACAQIVPAADPVSDHAESPEARRVLAWIVRTADNRGLPILIVDKVAARVSVFDPQGRAIAGVPALLGAAIGDISPTGIGNRKLSTITEAERITPAGRFPSVIGQDISGKYVLWVDYADSIALHAVVTSNPAEHRLERLATPSSGDNRISYGCINVPELFFRTVVRPLFTAAGGIVYVLPEERSVDAVFSTRIVDWPQRR